MYGGQLTRKWRQCNVDKVRANSPPLEASLCKNPVSIEAATEFDFPDVQYIWDNLIGSMIALTAEGRRRE